MLTSNDVDLLNTKVVQKDQIHRTLSPGQRHLPSPSRIDFPLIIVRSNAMRNDLNWECVRRRSEELLTIPIMCVANLKTQTNRCFTRRDLNFLLFTNDA